MKWLGWKAALPNPKPWFCAIKRLGCSLQVKKKKKTPKTCPLWRSLSALGFYELWGKRTVSFQTELSISIMTLSSCKVARLGGRNEIPLRVYGLTLHDRVARVSVSMWCSPCTPVTSPLLKAYHWATPDYPGCEWVCVCVWYGLASHLGCITALETEFSAQGLVWMILTSIKRFLKVNDWIYDQNLWQHIKV